MGTVSVLALLRKSKALLRQPGYLHASAQRASQCNDQAIQALRKPTKRNCPARSLGYDTPLLFSLALLHISLILLRQTR
jgi:hypothetical protein